MKLLKQFSMTAILLVVTLSAWAQDPIKSQMGEEFFCKNKNYQFLVEGNYHYEKSKIYVCPKNIPVSVTVVNTDTQTPVPGAFTWTVNGSANSATTHTITLNDTDFSSNVAELICDFTDSMGQPVSLNQKVTDDIKLSFKEDAKNYQFDENDEQAYINSYGGTEDINTPWNFIETGSFDILEGKASKKKGYYAVNNIESNNTNLTVSPTTLPDHKDPVTFTHSGSGHSIVEIHGCHETKPELLLFTEGAKAFSMEFYKVCESDDDIRGYCPSNRKMESDCMTLITSPDYVCIDGGVDRSIDLMGNTNFIPKHPVTGVSLDKLEHDQVQQKWVIKAGPDLECNTTMHPNSPPDCPGSINFSDFEDEANEILDNIAITGVAINLPQLNINYDVIEDDGKLDHAGEQSHLVFIRQVIFGQSDLEVYFVDDLGSESNPLPGGGTSVSTVQGKAIAGLGGNKVAIRRDADGSTLAHELGHAKWSLIHPGGPGAGQFGVDDDENFMHGYNRSADKIKRYQFHLMH